MDVDVLAGDHGAVPADRGVALVAFDDRAVAPGGGVAVFTSDGGATSADRGPTIVGLHGSAARPGSGGAIIVFATAPRRPARTCAATGASADDLPAASRRRGR